VALLEAPHVSSMGCVVHGAGQGLDIAISDRTLGASNGLVPATGDWMEPSMGDCEGCFDHGSVQNSCISCGELRTLCIDAINIFARAYVGHGPYYRPH
jgi:hypothetical protein